MSSQLDTGFTGHQHEYELGLINMRGRFYDPTVGRFLTPDPVMGLSGQGINRFAYVRNNPLRYIDPSGFSGFEAEMLGPEGGGGGPSSAPTPDTSISIDITEAQPEFGLRIIGQRPGTVPVTTAPKTSHERGVSDRDGDPGKGATTGPAPKGEPEDPGRAERWDAARAAAINWVLDKADQAAALAGPLGPLEPLIPGSNPTEAVTNAVTDQLRQEVPTHPELLEQYEFMENGLTFLDVTIGAVLGGPAARVGANVADDVAVAASKLCFPAGTLILTPAGQVPIEELKVGDEVYAFDEQSGEIVVRPIEETFESITDMLIEVSYVGGRIAATPSHPFWIEGVGWLQAKNVAAGMRLRTSDGVAEVLELGSSAAEQVVYNFSVAEEHNYFAGQRPILVHNQDASFANYNNAIKEALGWLRAQGVDTSMLTEVRQSRIGGGRGLAVPGGSAGFRVEWDPRSGAHINAWAHKAKSPHFKFPGNAKSVQTLLRTLYCR